MADSKSEIATEDQAVELSRLGSIDDVTLRQLETWDDALTLSESLHDRPVIDLSEIAGSGFRVLEDKDKLLDKPFIAVSWRFNDGDWGKFVSVYVVTEDHEKWILNDGSTGIAKQFLDLTRLYKTNGGVVVSEGLRKSEYPTCKECGKPRPQTLETCDNPKCADTSEARSTGTTYYLGT